MRRRSPFLIAVLLSVALAATGVGPAASQTPDEPTPDEPAPAPPAGSLAVERVAGPERIATAVAVSQRGWQASQDVVLASAADFPDALAGGALAASLDAPLLLTDRAVLPPTVAAELTRLGAGRVTILGGGEAVGAGVSDALVAAGATVERIGGATRYQTAAAIAGRLGPVDEVVVASGEGFADALAAGALSAVDGTPVLLAPRDAVPDETIATIAMLGASAVALLGGEVALDATVETRLEDAGLDVERLAGADRYETSALVAGEALSRTDATALPLVLATGDVFPDALTAGPLAARLDGLLVTSPVEGPATARRLDRLVGLAAPRLDGAIVVGGRLTDAGQAALEAAAVDLLVAEPTAEAPGPSGAAATVDPLATDAAAAVLAAGGNAVDAAVAAAGVLGVVEPFSSGIGGGGFMLVFDPAEGRVVTFDSREEAPAGYGPEVFLDPATGEPIPFDQRVTSGLGVGVPGTVDGWALALERYGSRPLGELLEPGIEAADYGFPLDSTFVDQVEANAGRFGAFSSTTELYLPRDGQGAPEGSWFRNPDLAETYRGIAAEGRGGIYRGPVAQAIVDTVQSPPVLDAETRTVRPGVMTAADLADYQAIQRDPVSVEYRGHEVAGMGLPSSGGLTIGLALNQLERFDLGALPRDEALHDYLESTGLAWADRGAYMGDPEYVDAPVDGLLSQDYADSRSALIGETATVTPNAPGDPFAFAPDPSPSGPAPAAVSAATVGSTTHLTVSDPGGMVVAYTFTIEQTGGSGIVVPDRGFLLNNELTDFDPVPPHPNAPEAGKRPRSSMAPTIVLRDGEPVLALGSPGGATIITTVLQTTLGVLDFGLTLPEAIAAPRVADFNGPTVSAEEAFVASPEAALLEARGHVLAPGPEIGAATGIAFGADGSVTAAAEPVRRGGGSAAVTGHPPPRCPTPSSCLPVGSAAALHARDLDEVAAGVVEDGRRDRARRQRLLAELDA